jgi:alpha-1,2-mannosyltransferase
MSVLLRIREFAAKAAPDHAARPRTDAPSWLVVPGFIALAVSLSCYVLFVRHNPIYGLDLQMYRGGLRAFLDDDAVYRLAYTHLKLPYTYPPITLVFLTPLVWTGAQTALHAFNGVGMAALFLVFWFTTRILGYRGVAGRLGMAAVGVALMLWTEPFQMNFSLGQVNVLVMLPIVIDLSLSDRSRFKGVGIGLATASKLLPGLFVVYLLLTRRIRAAAVATATFVALTAAGWIIEPGGSRDYWIKGLAFDSHRVLMTLGPRFTGNQSLQGMVARVLGTETQNSLPWVAAVAVATLGGLALAGWAQRRGEEAMGMVAVGFTALLISPVSWSHYWLWIAPLVLVLVDVARRVFGRLQMLVAGLPALAILPFLVWPLRSGGQPSQLPGGLIWNADRYGGLLGRLAADPYIPTVAGLAVLAVIWLRTRPVGGTKPAMAVDTGSFADSRTSRRPDDDVESRGAGVGRQGGTVG